VAWPDQLNRRFTITAGVVLFATAAFHATGYASVSSAVLASGVKPALAAAMRALWLMFSAHLVVLGIMVILASGVPGARRLVLAGALIPAVDTALLLRFAGLFVGTVALALATVLLVLGGLLPPRREARGTGGVAP